MSDLSVSASTRVNSMTWTMLQDGLWEVQFKSTQ